MRTMKIGKSGIEASVVGMGAWAIGGDSMWGRATMRSRSVRSITRANWASPCSTLRRRTGSGTARRSSARHWSAGAATMCCRKVRLALGR